MSATVLLLLCVVACPVAMGLMMLFMHRGHRDGKGDKRDARADD